MKTRRRAWKTKLGIETLENRNLFAGLPDVAPLDAPTPLVGSIAEIAGQQPFGLRTLDMPRSCAPANNVAAAAPETAVPPHADAPASGPQTVIEPKVDLTVTITTVSGKPLQSVTSGETFVVTVSVEDLRNTPEGVFAAVANATWDGKLAEVVGPIRYGSAYPNVHTGKSHEGRLEEAGAVSGISRLYGGNYELFSVTMRATAAGPFAISLAPTGSNSFSETLVYGENVPVNSSSVRYGSAEVTITAASGQPSDAPVTTAPADASGQNTKSTAAVESTPTNVSNRAESRLAKPEQRTRPGADDVHAATKGGRVGAGNTRRLSPSDAERTQPRPKSRVQKMVASLTAVTKTALPQRLRTSIAGRFLSRG